MEKSNWFLQQVNKKSKYINDIKKINFHRDEFVEKVKESINPNPNEGFVIGLRRRRDFASQICLDYALLTSKQKKSMLLALAMELGSQDESYHEMIQTLPRSEQMHLILNLFLIFCGIKVKQDAKLSKDLKNSLYHANEKFFRLIASVPLGASFLLDLRRDLLEVIKEIPKKKRNEINALEYLNMIMKDLFATQQGLQLKRITLDSETILSYMIQKEAVHKFLSYEDLSHRINGKDRLCYGLFHSNMPERPLVFVEIAIMTEITGEIKRILQGKEDSKDLPLTHAIFYSINTTTLGLQGLNLASHLLFLSIGKIKQNFPSCTNFVTLSPVPGFSKWFNSKLDKEDSNVFTFEVISKLLVCFPHDNSRLLKILNENKIEKGNLNLLFRQFPEEKSFFFLQLKNKLKNHQWIHDKLFCSLIKEILMTFCLKYLLFERKGKKLFDSVANFHIQNGAQVKRINFLADLSTKGLQESYGLMVNYQYHLNLLDVTSVAYRRFSTATASNLAVQMICHSTSPLFQLLDRPYKDSLDIPLFARVMDKHILVLEKGKKVDAIYFISQGSVCLKSSPPLTLIVGDAFGSEAIFGATSEYNIETTSLCHFFMLLEQDLQKLMKKYPDFKEKFSSSILKRDDFISSKL